MNHDNVYDFFHGFSRIFVIIPIVILVAGLIVKLNQNKPLSLSYTGNKKISPVILNSSKKNNVSTIELNLQGPFICNFSSKEASISGYIKDGKAYGKIRKQKESTNIVLNGDCLYFWNNASSQGEKICGLRPYISMIGNLPLTSLTGNNSSLIPAKTIDIQSLANSCKKEEIQNEQMFDLPKNVIFKNKEMPQL